MKVGSAQGKGPYHIQAEINMIPLIDVALVLLIIFMVISPILVQSQLRVSLPKVTAAAQAEETALKVEIAPDGTMAFKGKILNLEELRVALQNALPSGHRAALLIQADQDVPFQHVVRVMDVAKQLKVDKLGVSVLPQITR
jgi:biopolymer transport protein ExbD